MKVYLDLVVLLNFAVNYGLLRATARLTGARLAPWRLGAGAAVGALYAGACVLQTREHSPQSVQRPATWKARMM